MPWKRRCVSLASTVIRLAVQAVLLPLPYTAQAGAVFATDNPQPQDVVLAGQGKPSSIYLDPNEDKAVQRAAEDLAADIYRVTGKRPQMVQVLPGGTESVVIIGTCDSGILQRLAGSGVLDLRPLARGPEAYLIQTLEEPNALVIAGSDRRGTIYGIYTISEAIGVSPWYWWADVPIRRRPVLAIRPVRFVQDPPAVRYRGIFINDEDFGLRPWAAQTFDPEFGNIGPKTYAKVFELLLRLKANLLWPAMHEGTVAFNRIPKNRRLADEYGIVIGSSHCEQMLRNNVDEWHRDGNGQYNYVTNQKGVLAYWEARVKEFAGYEGIYTVGMRGIHDSGMPGGGSPAQQAQRLHRIIADQRDLLSRYVKDLAQVPQMFCPYKEVLDLYRLSPDIPGDITICWPDDNWGYVRQFCNEQERARPGRAGVYYHLSYWGRPYDYLWLCSTPLGLVWEEMTKAYDYGANRIWIANVGDIKPAEIGMEFFLDLAWDPHKYGPDGIRQYLAARFSRDLGPEYAERIAAVMLEYYRLCLQRRPEHMGIDPRNSLLKDVGFSVMLNGDEAQRRLEAFKDLAAEVDQIERQLPSAYKDAFFQLVAYAVKAAASMNEKGLNLSRAMAYAAQGRACAARYLDQAQRAYRHIQDLTDTYNNHVAGGKWRGMMSASPRNLAVFASPKIELPPVPEKVLLGVAVEGSDRVALGTSVQASLQLPQLSGFGQRRYFIDVFAAGTQTFEWTATASADWICAQPASGTGDQRIWVSVDWQKAPRGPDLQGGITITAGDQVVSVKVTAFNPDDIPQIQAADFVQDDRTIVIEAENTSFTRPGLEARWQQIDGLGYNGKAMFIQPFGAKICSDPNTIRDCSPSLEYTVWTFTPGTWDVEVRALPTFSAQAGLPQRVAVAFDQEGPKVTAFPLCLSEQDPNWQRGVLRNMVIATSRHDLARPGPHVLKVWMVDPGVVVDSIIAYTGDRPHTGYTLPEETRCRLRH